MMKDQKGITLVALIITIIVMLILVAVTISVAMNGGLFDNARDANRKTKQAQVSEAAALAKAELLSNFYSANTNAQRTAPTTDNVRAAVQKYLDTSITVAAEPAGSNKWTITSAQVDYDSAKGETEPVIDLSDLDFASGT